ncbi:M16 family metallopeptidase [Acidobacteriota bacterium]
MRRLRYFYFFTLLILAFFSSPVLCQEESEATKSFEMENGIKVYLYERHNVPLIHTVFAFNIGSKDEDETTSGLVHVLEHYILFRGTHLRSGQQVGIDIRRHGAYFNAHTGRDLSLFELSFPSEHLDFALKNQKDILFNLQVSQEELDEEKQVILEEYNQMEDDPQNYALSLFHQNLFTGHSYESPLHGIRDVIQSLTPELLEKFYAHYFVPENCALAVVGDFDIVDMEAKVQQYFSDIPRSGLIQKDFPMAESITKNIEVTKEMDVNKATMIIGTLGPDYNNTSQYNVDVLAQVLGRGISPLLTIALRGRRDLVDSAYMGYSAYKFGGAIYAYLTLDPKDIKTVRRQALEFLKSAWRINFSKKDYLGESRQYALDYLANAKNQILFDYHQSQENGLNIAVSLARYLLLNNKPERGKYLDYIEAIDSSDLRETASQFLGKGKYVIITITPKKK